MSQRVRIQNMVAEMHEKNRVLINILRDIVENEYGCELCMDDDDEVFWRKLTDTAVRRAEILAEIKHFLRCENLEQRLNA